MLHSKIRRLTDCAYRATFRTSLRSSSLREPNDPLLTVVDINRNQKYHLNTVLQQLLHNNNIGAARPTRVVPSLPLKSTNDPHAGSPTSTLLRLLLPLKDQVCWVSQQSENHRSAHLTKPFNRKQRRAVCTKSRDVVSAL